MPRIFFSESSREAYFSSLKTKSGLSWGALAKSLLISERQLRDWRYGIYSLPDTTAKLIEELFKHDLPKDTMFKADYWHISEAAKKGAKKRFELYGSLATPEGRRKGDLTL